MGGLVSIFIVMKKTLSLILFASLLFAVGCEKEPVVSPADPGTHDIPDNPEPRVYQALSGVFSVSATTQVRFAAGNLGYDTSFFFTSHQYDYGGHFCWGTGNNPTSTSSDYHDYPTFVDWGGIIGDGWRTLSRPEWKYLIEQREDAIDKRGEATVCGVHGLVILPDTWNGPAFNPVISEWNSNVYDAASWATMETAGAVFLPAAGLVQNMNLTSEGVFGHYWLSTPNDDNYGFDFYFGVAVNAITYNDRSDGLSVRLAQDIRP